MVAAAAAALAPRGGCLRVEDLVLGGGMGSIMFSSADRHTNHILRSPARRVDVGSTSKSTYWLLLRNGGLREGDRDLIKKIKQRRR